MKTKTKYTDAELVQLLKESNIDAFSYLYDNYAAALNGIIRKLISDDKNGDIILKDSLVKICTQIATFDSTRCRLFTWMALIARSTALYSLEFSDPIHQIEPTDSTCELSRERAVYTWNIIPAASY